MRRTAAIFLCLFMVLSASVCSAQTIDSMDYGVSFSLPDTWIQQYYQFGFGFYHSENANETLIVESIPYQPAYYTDVVDSAILRDKCHAGFSDAELAANMTAYNNKTVTVVGDCALENYEYHNGVKYYRYEKAYTAYMDGNAPTAFYITAYITAANGRIYSIVYGRDYSTNNFADVTAMLDSMSYENGLVKIKINGEMIYPDSDPIVIYGRTLVPIRAIAERMGYIVEWDGDAQTVRLTSYDAGNILTFTVNSMVAYKNDIEISLDVPTEILNGRTYLPVRAVTEAMDAGVNWDAATRTVEIWK